MKPASEQGSMTRRLRSDGRQTTLRDVAEHCGVSTMTVSKILNGKGGVSKETARRIRKAMAELHYTPNLVAKSLRVNRTRTFGVVTSDSSELLFAKMIKGIIDEAADCDYSVIMANTNQTYELERESVTVLLNKRIDGLVLAAPFKQDPELFDEIRSFGIPFVLLMRSSTLDVDFVSSDNVQGAYDMVSYLIGKGERDIRFLNLHRDHQNGEERRRGYQRALADNGIAYDESKVHYIIPEIECARQAMAELIRSGVRTGAFFCGCDIIAVGAIQAVLDAGLTIPGDIRICGFDDIAMLDYLNVPLTTMRQQVYEMGREGIRLLLARLDNPDASPVRTLLPCELVVRKST